ncbi:MAG TPA: hypothetical protein VIN08_15765 [Ohtaekwangia sp.]|uniref:hypothetical protein n=1 Tax=Ohtaekwangia sp. TaxID=2066019 RepID=UPI002F95B12E
MVKTTAQKVVQQTTRAATATAVKVVKKLETSNAARREAMRQQKIPTSQQPKSQSKNKSGREYSYETAKKNTTTEGGSTTETKSVQQQTMDSSHEGQPHWEAGTVKTHPNTGEVLKNNYDRPKLTSDKSKVDY